MSKQFYQTAVLLLALCWLAGCAGGPEEGTYTGAIGKKDQIVLTINPDGSARLEGYWQESLTGTHERGSLKGQNMDALVFEGPESKKFKLRFLYEEDDNGLIIQAIHSRNYGPGARYVPTEKDGVFSPPPRLTKVSSN